jgi:hypothetical protein
MTTQQAIGNKKPVIAPTRFVAPTNVAPTRFVAPTNVASTFVAPTNVASTPRTVAPSIGVRAPVYFSPVANPPQVVFPYQPTPTPTPTTLPYQPNIVTGMQPPNAVPPQTPMNNFGDGLSNSMIQDLAARYGLDVNALFGNFGTPQMPNQQMPNQQMPNNFGNQLPPTRFPDTNQPPINAVAPMPSQPYQYPQIQPPSQPYPYPQIQPSPQKSIYPTSIGAVNTLLNQNQNQNMSGLFGAIQNMNQNSSWI